MSGANTQAVNEFRLLPNDWRAMTIADVREFRGPNRDSETGNRTRLVDMTYKDSETGALVHQNYSLDKPSYLAAVLEAVAPGESEQMLADIDWETDDINQVLNIEIKAKVYREEFPLGSGLYRNKIGNVVNIATAIEEEMAPSGVTDPQGGHRTIGDSDDDGDEQPTAL